MAINYNPTTVSDGLVLALDAANTRSYPGSGTAWTDISYRGNNGTLTNGPTFVAPPYNEPFGGAGGVYFDGDGDYLSVSPTFDFELSNGDFTIESWIYSATWSSTNANAVFSKGNTTSVSTEFYSLQATSSGVIQFFWRSGSALLSGPTLSKSVWYHVAVTRSGDTFRLFVNGNLESTTTSSTTLSTGVTGGVLVGGQSYDPSDTTRVFDGYISNLRIVKGTAVYTSNFTPPRVLLSRVPNTSLLTCQGGTIRDASSNNFTITPNGDASAVSYAPYIKFDGVDDFVINSSSTNIPVGNSSRTIQFWVYPKSNTNNFIQLGTGGGNQVYIVAFYNFSGTIYLFTDGINEANNISISGSQSPTLNTWNHITFGNSGQNWFYYLNGVFTTSGTFAVTLNTVGQKYIVGKRDDVLQNTTNGNIAQVSIYNRALTAEEVLQNYNALKGRFGL